MFCARNYHFFFFVCSKSDELIVPVQNAIQGYCENAMHKVKKLHILLYIPFFLFLKVICLLSHPNESISKEAIALMKTMLFSGNELVQEGLARSVQETREETLFINLKDKLEMASTKFKET